MNYYFLLAGMFFVVGISMFTIANTQDEKEKKTLSFASASFLIAAIIMGVSQFF